MSPLFWLIAVPLIASAAAFIIPPFSKRLAVLASFFPLALLLAFPLSGTTINYPWLPPLSIAFHLSVDPLSLLFLYLTAAIIPISMIAIQSKAYSRPHLFYGFVLLLEAFLIGFFTARDLALFTIFWEAMLLPLYFIITLWGGTYRQRAGLKFLLYMIAGSALMIAGVLSLFLTSSTFDLGILSQAAKQAPHAPWIFAVFLLAFAVKTPLFPFHAWLPDAYTQAPTAGTILLSALLSKAGIYGILRIGFELFPFLLSQWSPWLLTLAIIGVFYGGLAAWMEQDFKRLLAYSSFAHVNFVLAGLFIWNDPAHAGAVLQALNHGITIAALFLVSGWLEERIGSTAFGTSGGLAKSFPNLCWITLVFVLSSVALPGTNNFVGEVMILLGLFGIHPWLASFLAITMILSAVYMLRWMQKLYFETPHPPQRNRADIHAKEIGIALSLIALIFWIGLYPSPVLKQIDKGIVERRLI